MAMMTVMAVVRVNGGNTEAVAVVRGREAVRGGRWLTEVLVVRTAVLVLQSVVVVVAVIVNVTTTAITPIITTRVGYRRYAPNTTLSLLRSLVSLLVT
jgi:hypothetical protein